MSEAENPVVRKPSSGYSGSISSVSIESFPNRMYENPSIREMFRSLDLIESFGFGVGKAKRAMAQNGSDTIHHEQFDDNIDITSVVIPKNRRYLEYSDKAMDGAKRVFGKENPNSDAERPNLDFEGKESDIGVPESIKLNEVDVLGLIRRFGYSNTIQEVLLDIYDFYFNDVFCRADIVSSLQVSKASGTSYIKFLSDIHAVEPVKGKGKGKYRFR